MACSFSSGFCRDQDVSKAPLNHSPNFFVDEGALVVGAQALASVAVNYLTTSKSD